MAHHKSAKKRIRQTSKRRTENRYYGKTTRNAIRKFEDITDKTAAQEKLSEIVSMVDKLAKRNQIHKNKASNMKSALMKHVNKLA
jgi:small subunit ribosomal protein S20